MELFLLILFSIISLTGGINLVIQKNIVYSALSLICVMISIAAIFILMNAAFIGVLQILLYAGAIMVLFLFIIMLINPQNTTSLKQNIYWVILNIVISLIASSLLTYGLFVTIDANNFVFLITSTPISLENITLNLFTTHLFSLEIIAILLTAAVIGSLLMAIHFIPKSPSYDH